MFGKRRVNVLEIYVRVAGGAWLFEAGWSGPEIWVLRLFSVLQVCLFLSRVILFRVYYVGENFRK